MTAEAFLASVPLFAALAADHLRSIAPAGRTKTVATAETVFREGDASNGLYVALSGKVRIYKQSGRCSCRSVMLSNILKRSPMCVPVRAARHST
jgi:CRP-like cAMP-binding protein